MFRTGANLKAVLDARARGVKRGETVIGGLLGIEGAHPLVRGLDKLQRAIGAGHRLFGLQHFSGNALGGSQNGRCNHGLTDFGYAVAADLPRRPVIIDVAHSSPHVARDRLRMKDVPIVLGHSGIHSHGRSNAISPTRPPR